MMRYVLGSSLIVLGAWWLLSRHRCHWLQSHDVRWRLRRDDLGKLITPEVLEWYCFSCGKHLGVTKDERSFSLMASLRRQVRWSRQRSRLSRVA